jgi:hypothetical protein
VTSDAAGLLVVAVSGAVDGRRHAGGRIVDEVDDVLMQNRSVGLQREQIVAATGDNPFGDVGLMSRWR